MHSRALGRAAIPGGATRRSVVAAAAYRSGERLFDASQGKWFEFDKPDVVHTEILVPEGWAPDWITDRQTLWNMVERSEKRVDAQLCREVELTLPRELSPEQRVELVRQFVKDHFVDRFGMVADFAIHNPAALDLQEQPHAHVLLTLRRLDPSSETGFARVKSREWNEDPEIARLVAEARKRFNNTNREEDKEALERAEALRNVNMWRKGWQDCANAALADAGSDARIDHRTLEKQGIFRLPQISLGIARHIEKAYDFLKERVTQWVGIKKRARLYEEAEHLKRRDPATLTDFVLRLGDMAESFAAEFRKPPDLAHGQPPPTSNREERDLER